MTTAEVNSDPGPAAVIREQIHEMIAVADSPAVLYPGAPVIASYNEYLSSQTHPGAGMLFFPSCRRSGRASPTLVLTSPWNPCANQLLHRRSP